MSQSISILDGNAFVVSDLRGDLEATPTDTFGLFLNDTRFLSRWVLTVDGRRPNVLSTDTLRYFRAQFYTTLSTGTIYVDSDMSLVRRRAVGDGFMEEIIIANHGKEPKRLQVRIEAGSDFADLFEVKDKLAKRGSSIAVSRPTSWSSDTVGGALSGRPGSKAAPPPTWKREPSTSLSRSPRTGCGPPRSR